MLVIKDMPETAKVAIYEDNKEWGGYIQKALIGDRHCVVAFAKKYEEAEVLTAKILSGEVEVDAVCMDGNLGNSYEDGSFFASQLQEAGIPVIGTSASLECWSDHPLSKDPESMEALGPLVTSL